MHPETDTEFLNFPNVNPADRLDRFICRLIGESDKWAGAVTAAVEL